MPQLIFINGIARTVWSDEEKKQMLEEKTMAEKTTKEIVDRDLLLESLRINLDKVQKEKSALEEKELKIRKQIESLVQGESK